MKYMGSKARHAAAIGAILQPLVSGATAFVEPFVGGASITSVISHPVRLASDVDPDLITMWRAVSEGWMPPESVSEQDYDSLRRASTTPSALKGYVAFAMSYGGKKWGGYRRDSAGVRDYGAEAYRAAEKQFPKLRGVRFSGCAYDKIEVPPGSVVYCDPPYAGTTGYSVKFDSAAFWGWVRSISTSAIVLVSEYAAPPDFLAIWEKPVKSSLTRDTGALSATERLFIRAAA